MNAAIQQLLEHYAADERIRKIASDSELIAELRLHLSGMVGSQDAVIAASLFNIKPASHLFVLETKEEAAYFLTDLQNLLGKKDLLFFPDSFKKPGSMDKVDKNNLFHRTETASHLLHKPDKPQLIVTYPHAFFEKMVNAKALEANILEMHVNEKLDLNFVKELLIEYGFEHTDFVYEPGQFAVRGGIVDIFSFGNEMPYRVEFFGDEVESIRTFNPITQYSERNIKKVSIIPDVQAHFDDTQKTSFFKLLPDDCTVWVKDMNGLLEINRDCYEKTIQITVRLEKSGIVEDHPVFKGEVRENFINSDELLTDLLEKSIIEFGGGGYFKNAETIEFVSRPQPSFNKNFNMLKEDLEKRYEDDCNIFLFAGNARQSKRFRYIFDDLDAKFEYLPVNKSLHQGFIDPLMRLLCYTDHQVFQRYQKHAVRRGFSRNQAMSVKMLNSLNKGDFVTHIDHGIGIYQGLRTITVNDKVQEVMQINYKGTDVLYVNINSLHKVTRYIGKEGKPPRVNRLGSEAWAAVKRKAKRKIKEIAFDLIKLYAKRKSSQGFAFSPDTYIQTELEASFIYEDTPDQEKATVDVKTDMENIIPMDRLICGDVGFGKTEIAVRAAAKAVVDGKQVAVLVPTTILAMQHFHTFSERMRDIPCTIDFLNRFKTAKQKRETLAQLAEGKIDIIIGTHAIISKSVKFKDLGLLVIDEEQKFGVAAKEKLRTLKINVDTLTLTATPIPRTLQFSLMSARDMSMILTPPPNRQPVKTELIRFDEERIAEAVLEEVYRGGQVFFVHNRVKDLYEVAGLLQRLCPEVDIGVAHGQMKNKELEDHMLKFIGGTYDVLVSTNIVESGLDIPNANTIIVNNAHWFGLSDLYQLRGRVGRSNKKAYCYLVCPPPHTLSTDSNKRLKVIEEFSNLGDGINVAMRDLDIRGAGNLLGAEQSGFIADIGFDAYQKILAEAVQELKESDFKDLFADQMEKERTYVSDCQMDTDLELLIPMEYVQSTNERLRLYTELDNVETEEKLIDFCNKMRDRFGPLPPQVKELAYAVRLRWVAKRLGFERLVFKSRKLRCYFVSNQNSPYYDSDLFAAVLQYVQHNAGKANFKQTNKYLLVVFDNIHSMKKARALLLEMDDFVKERYQGTSSVTK